MISKPPGVEDIFPDRGVKWNYIKNIYEDVFRTHNFREIVVPVMEFTEVFARGIGDDTDIVSKEMFTFEDRGGRSLTLRPEGTAGVVRAYVENGEYNRLSSCKFFYAGPMFRAEKPQRGRLRQFNQFGAEVFGSDDPYYDFEIISVVDSISKRIGIGDYRILINSIGCRECRPAYMEKLKGYYRQYEESLCQDCRKRLEKNPLRLLDCKNESCRALRENAPLISENICESCSDHFCSVKKYLDRASIEYTLDPFLVRGLDYYTRTTFEFVSDSLGSQSAFAGGGRYDHLVEQFDGKPTPGVGFAAGIERLNLLIEDKDVKGAGIDAFVIHSGGESLKIAVNMVNDLRAAGISSDLDPGSRGFKSQFKKADREGASYALIIGEDEALSGNVSVKDFKLGKQETIPLKEIVNHLNKITNV